jgi:hypothetical protein
LLQALPHALHARHIPLPGGSLPAEGKRFTPSAVLELERPGLAPVPVEIPGSLQTLDPLGGGGGDPWEGPQWRQYKWTVYRGVAYDLTAFIDRHPAGAWLVRLAIGRDCTALFESYHLRPEVYPLLGGRAAKTKIMYLDSLLGMFCHGLRGPSHWDKHLIGQNPITCCLDDGKRKIKFVCRITWLVVI